MLALFAASTSFSAAAVNRPLTISGTNAGPGLLPTGQYITATLAPGSAYYRLSTGLRGDGNADADSAMWSALSPDGKTLLVLTSGFNTSINYESGPPILFPVLNPITGKPAPFTLPGAAPATGYNQTEWVFVYRVGFLETRSPQSSLL